MKSLPDDSMNRRHFFVTAARSGMLLALATFAAWQESKRRRLASDPKCIKLAVCYECVEFDRCSKPKAQSARGFASIS